MKKRFLLVATPITLLAIAIGGLSFSLAGYSSEINVDDSSHNNILISSKGSQYSFKVVLASSDWYNASTARIYVNFSTATTPTSSNSIYSYWTCNKTSSQVTLSYTLSNVTTSHTYLSIYRVNPSYDLYDNGALNDSHIWNRTSNFTATSYLTQENVVYTVTGYNGTYSISI